MKDNHPSILGCITSAGAVLTIAATTAFAQPQPPPYSAPPPPSYSPGYNAPGYNGANNYDAGFYLGGDVGLSFMQDFNSSRFGFPGEFKADPGVRFGIEPGFNFLATQQFTLGAEFETGLIYNYVYSVKNAGFDTGMRGDSYQVPVLGNLLLKLHVDPFITPYIGFGGGGDYTDLEIRTPGFFHSRTTSDEFDPAVQGIVGVRFRINPITDLGVEYKYIAAFPNEGSTLQTHAIMASFNMKF
jgi:opacity protein-like surface antigen